MLEPILLSLKLSLITTILLFILCLYPAFYLSRVEFFAKKILLSIIMMPLVLPPTVLGFYLLIFLSPNSFIGEFLDQYDIRLVFNFTGLLIASFIYSLPFMFEPLYNAFSNLPKNLYDKAKLLEKSTANLIFRLCLPIMKSQVFNACIICFAHTMGEFGVVMMVGGSKENETKLASIVVFEAMENLDYALAHKLSLILLGISFVVLFIIQIINKKN